MDTDKDTLDILNLGQYNGYYNNLSGYHPLYSLNQVKTIQDPYSGYNGPVIRQAVTQSASNVNSVAHGGYPFGYTGHLGGYLNGYGGYLPHPYPYGYPNGVFAPKSSKQE